MRIVNIHLNRKCVAVAVPATLSRMTINHLQQWIQPTPPQPDTCLHKIPPHNHREKTTVRPTETACLPTLPLNRKTLQLLLTAPHQTGILQDCRPLSALGSVKIRKPHLLQWIADCHAVDVMPSHRNQHHAPTIDTVNPFPASIAGPAAIGSST